MVDASSHPLAIPRPGDGASSDAWPLYGRVGTRVLETSASRALGWHVPMQRAGDAVARLALALAPHARRIWVAAGPGNNGGDGFEAAAVLSRAGKQVTIGVSTTDGLPAEAQASLAHALAAGATLMATPRPLGLGPLDLAIDALFGIGLRSAPEGWHRDAIAELNASPAPTLAVDVPSGLDGEHGSVFDPVACVRARWTLALLSLKPGLFTGQGRDHAGSVWFSDLGYAAGLEPAAARLSCPGAASWPSRRHAHHKGSFGDVWAVGGAAGMAGAVVLCARAASLAGAGRVMLAPLDPAVGAFDLERPELMLREVASLQSRSVRLEESTVVCGSGAGSAPWPWFASVLSRAGRLLLDADALNALAHDPGLQAQLARRAAQGRHTILTPHPLEAARLLGTQTAAIQSDRLAAARELAARFALVVVLKGSGTVIAAPGEPPWINASGNACLASAGTGDVLAGWIGGLWSQGLAAIDAARLGVHSHGAAADAWQARRARPAALPASALLEELGRPSKAQARPEQGPSNF